MIKKAQLRGGIANGTAHMDIQFNVSYSTLFETGFSLISLI